MNVLALPARTIPKLPLRRLTEAGSFQYRFDDLSLDIEGGFSAGSFNGTANITYHEEDGNLFWFVHEIYLDCSKWNGASWDVRTIEIEREHDLYIKLWGELTDGRKDSIQAKVEGEI